MFGVFELLNLIRVARQKHGINGSANCWDLSLIASLDLFEYWWRGYLDTSARPWMECSLLTTGPLSRTSPAMCWTDASFSPLNLFANKRKSSRLSASRSWRVIVHRRKRSDPHLIIDSRMKLHLMRSATDSKARTKRETGSVTSTHIGKSFCILPSCFFASFFPATSPLPFP